MSYGQETTPRPPSPGRSPSLGAAEARSDPAAPAPLSELPRRQPASLCQEAESQGTTPPRLQISAATVQQAPPGCAPVRGIVTRPGSSPPACALIHEVRDPALPRYPEPVGVVADHFGEDAVAPRTPPLLEEPVPACPSSAQSIDGGDSLRPYGASP